MAGKATFFSKTFASKTFASGTWAGIGVPTSVIIATVGWEEPFRDNTWTYHPSYTGWTEPYRNNVWTSHS